MRKGAKALGLLVRPLVAEEFIEDTGAACLMILKSVCIFFNNLIL